MRSGATRAERTAERRTQLAQSALATLGELGYARTSLREIAQNSEFTHGVVHYYFADKVELITHCVRLYKTQCVTRFDEIVDTSTTAEELLERFALRLVESIVTEAPLHRLWYDLRTQSLFEDAFRQDVLEIDETLQGLTWRVVTRYAAFLGGSPLLDERATYALIDGLFEKALLHHIAGLPSAGADLAARVRWLLPQICPGDKSGASTAAEVA
ncbi:TetR/AcrR family transcriptional regulator [Nocardioides agariphilus]|jgi:AcrR family transcriptional regulator|uniref:TetR/AcrR family transcriptional regulator n=2 Tax=Nocardioides agariphilus TaxID=433664 RepID=A0A930YHT7_9ACTN|nr:TetR/AcrR family transcriptional regulator [Nocardioides agariphilus]MBF4767487.1 TetR/AcrR family transcriptional regulator [Nocardioides agariphilus]